jgi:hypothetical protein
LAIALLVLVFGGILVDIGYSVFTLPALLKYPPLESEFGRVKVGMTKADVDEIFRAREGRRYAQYEMDEWQFWGAYYCYSIVFEAETKLVARKHKEYPPFCMSDAEPRGLIMRWAWTKWDEIRAERQQRLNRGLQQ